MRWNYLQLQCYDTKPFYGEGHTTHKWQLSPQRAKRVTKLLSTHRNLSMSPSSWTSNLVLKEPTRQKAEAWCCRELQNCLVDTEICLCLPPPEQAPSPKQLSSKQCSSLQVYLRWVWPVSFSFIPRPRVFCLGMGTTQRLLMMQNVPKLTKVEPFRWLSCLTSLFVWFSTTSADGQMDRTESKSQTDWSLKLINTERNSVTKYHKL